MIVKRRITLDELPQYHELVRTMLSGGALPQRVKTEAELVREFDVEKWGGLLREAEQSGVGFGYRAVDRLHMATLGHCVSVHGDALVWEPQTAATRRFRRLIGETLASLMPATALVEFGAGYGGMFFAAARAVRSSAPALYALEYSASGRELIRRIAAAEGLNVTIGACNLSAVPMTPVAIPPGAVIFTCFAAHYVPVMSEQFTESLRALQPKAVAHFEPLVHPETEQTTLGILRRRYLESNDYNRNMFDVLTSAQRAGRIRIESMDRAWFGLNPLLPASRVIWTLA